MWMLRLILEQQPGKKGKRTARNVDFLSEDFFTIITLHYCHHCCHHHHDPVSHRNRFGHQERKNDYADITSGYSGHVLLPNIKVLLHRSYIRFSYLWHAMRYANMYTTSYQCIDMKFIFSNFYVHKYWYIYWEYRTELITVTIKIIIN